ncbi:hypothetical protein N182_34165 [Sinorhizobium sp. GL2]|nr:hypothetical protein N182_34165 [Sinorhizobium sp. GL2]
MDQHKFGLEEDFKYLEKALADVTERIQLVADKFERGAVLAYPGSFSDPELFRTQEALVARSEQILERMRQLHTAMVAGGRE